MGLRGPGAHSVGQGLTVTQGCFCPRPVIPQSVTGLRGPGALSVGQGLTLTAAPTPGQWLAPSSLVHRGHSVGQGLTVKAAPTPDRDLLSPRWGAEPGAHTAPQCRPRANCDCCAHRDPDPHTLMRAASAPRRQWAGGSDRLLDRSGLAPRQPGHVRLGQSFSKPPDPLPPRAAVPNRRGSDPPF